MNFKKLQKMQAELDNSILSTKPEMTAEERFNKTLVALSVEVAELANCAEHFKFWKDNKRKVDSKRFVVNSSIVNKLVNGDFYDVRERVYVSTEQAHKLTLIEEASDCLYFILSLANQLGVELDNPPIRDFDISKELIYLKINGSTLSCSHNYVRENFGFCQANINKVNFYFINYVNSLGIITEELEQAYYEKKKRRSASR